MFMFSQAVGKSFNAMESKITEVGRSAIRIGTIARLLRVSILIIFTRQANNWNRFILRDKGHRLPMICLTTITDFLEATLPVLTR